MDRMAITLALAALLFGCATTQQPRRVDITTFLGDYSDLLEEGEGKDPAYIYIKPGSDVSSFNKIMLDPVTAWRGEKSRKGGVAPGDMQTATDLFYSTLHEHLSKDFQIVSTPADDVLRLRVAVTTANQSTVILDTVSTVIPQLRGPATLVGFARGKPLFVGEAGMEAVLTDAGTGELLGAVVDRRVGGKTVRGVTNSWDDVRQSFTWWAETLRWRLCTYSDRGNCGNRP